LGSGFAGIAIAGTNGVTAMTDGKQDVVVLFDPETGKERWRSALGRTRKRGEGVPLGPLSTPAIDAEAVYSQALDGRFVCLGLATGRPLWEVNVKRDFKAFEPGYGFASSPLLLDDLVVLLPAGSSSASAVALDRRTGAVRWRASLGSGAEYVSATARGRGDGALLIVQVGAKLAGLAAADGRTLWVNEEIAGGLWTPSILRNGQVFCPAAAESRLLDPGEGVSRVVWSSPVFESTMGPVAELNGMLVGHHQRRLTALDAATGIQLWQHPTESDGQLLVLGNWLIFVNDREGRLEVIAVDRKGFQVRHQQPVMKPGRMETPLTFASGRLLIRGPEELVALRVE
jgi:outer membrane protein assembly factor BamB